MPSIRLSLQPYRLSNLLCGTRQNYRLWKDSCEKKAPSTGRLVSTFKEVKITWCFFFFLPLHLHLSKQVKDNKHRRNSHSCRLNKLLTNLPEKKVLYYCNTLISICHASLQWSRKIIIIIIKQNLMFSRDKWKKKNLLLYSFHFRFTHLEEKKRIIKNIYQNIWLWHFLPPFTRKGNMKLNPPLWKTLQFASIALWLSMARTKGQFSFIGEKKCACSCSQCPYASGASFHLDLFTLVTESLTLMAGTFSSPLFNIL